MAATHLDPGCDDRGFLRESDRQARQRLIDERGKLVSLAGAVQHMIQEYDRTIGGARYPYADNGFDSQFAALCRAAFAVFHADELHALGVAHEPQMQEARVVQIVDQRGIGPASYSEAAE